MGLGHFHTLFKISITALLFWDLQSEKSQNPLHFVWNICEIEMVNGAVERVCC